MRDTRIKVACVGSGYFSQFHLDAWRRINPVDLVGVTDHDPARARATGLPAFDNLDIMLEATRPDLVDLVVPPTEHLAIIRSCIAGGVKTIICQKPFCQNLDEAQLAMQAADEAGVELVIHENFRFQPWYRRMKEAIDEELLGDLHQFTFRLRTGDGQGPQAYLSRQPYFQTMERFLIHETGVHWLDTFRFLFGEPVSVYADLRKMNPAIRGEDAGYMILEFANGVRALFDGNRHLDHSSKDTRTTFGEALLEGSRGTIELSGTGELAFRRFGSIERQMLLAPSTSKGFAGDCVFALQDHVIHSLLNGTKPENTAAEYIRIIELEQAVYASAASGKRVHL
jgi:predicted dehydrogenase